MLDVRLISPLEKVFPDAAPALAQQAFEGFENESVSFQLAYTCDEALAFRPVRVEVESPLAAYITVRAVQCVPVMTATRPGADDNYLRKAPGLYPDLLRAPRGENPQGESLLLPGLWQSCWIECDPAGRAAAGTYPVAMCLRAVSGEELARRQATVTILPGKLPPQTLIRTQWFHSDCLADYYRVPVFSEEHWRIVENFMRTAAHRGMNMILTPLFTPPLDTAVGRERTTVQLIDVTAQEGGYAFGFARFRRWVETARRAGIEYFEMCHLFTQWGALHAPKIVDTAGQRIFGWETEACGPEYAAFLKAFLPALMAEVRALGLKERVYFHISDEPKEDQLPQYIAARKLVEPYVEGCPIIDALSDIAFYASGAATRPIPALNRIQPFLDAGVPNLWSYCCVGQFKDVSNLFIAMPAARTRMLGVQLYKYELAGFLQWGYNFYNAPLSAYRIDPFASTDSAGCYPAGDPFSVYPGEDGQAMESIRLLLIHMAMQDLRALRQLEALAGREHVLALIEAVAAGPLTLTEYPRDPAFFTALRKRVNGEIIEFSKRKNR